MTLPATRINSTKVTKVSKEGRSSHDDVIFCSEGGGLSRDGGK